jgi:hypothetical protein
VPLGSIEAERDAAVGLLRSMLGGLGYE